MTVEKLKQYKQLQGEIKDISAEIKELSANKTMKEHSEKVKKYLNQERWLYILIVSNKEELKKLKDDAKVIGGIDYSKERVSGNVCNDANYIKIVEKIELLEKRINNDINNFFDLKLQIRTAINNLINRDEQTILRLKYINYMSWDRICEELEMSERSIHRIHSNALQNFKIPQ